MKWSTLTGVAALVLIGVLSLRDFAATAVLVVQTGGFVVGLVVGSVLGANAARPFHRQDGYTNRTKLIMAWFSFFVLFTVILLLAFLAGLPGREGVIPELAQGMLLGSAGFFWLTVLRHTVWKMEEGGVARRFSPWFALVASGGLASIIAAAVLERYALSHLTRAFGG